MANLIITNVCNMSCDFCFAGEHLSSKSTPADRMHLDEYRRLLGFMDGDQVRFCGGEPSTHPDIIEMIEIALSKKGRGVFMMTNAVWPDALQRYFEELPRRKAARIRCLVNALDPMHYSRGQQERFAQTLRALVPKTLTLGFTIDRADFDFDYVFDLAEAHGIERLRYSIASPSISDARSWRIDPGSNLRALASEVHQLFVRAAAKGLFVHSDCGYIPPCLFTPKQLADLPAAGDDEPLRFSCSGAVDIGVGGEAWRCYGLYSGRRGNVADFETLPALAAHLEEQVADFDSNFLFDDCAACDYRARGECAGGCYALRSVQALRLRAGEHEVSLDDDAAMRDVVIRKNAGRLRAFSDGRWMCRDSDGTWAELRLTEREARFLDAVRDERTVAQVADACGGDSADIARFARRFIASACIEIGAPQQRRRGLRILSSDAGETAADRR